MKPTETEVQPSTAGDAAQEYSDLSALLHALNRASVWIAPDGIGELGLRNLKVFCNSRLAALGEGLDKLLHPEEYVE